MKDTISQEAQAILMLAVYIPCIILGFLMMYYAGVYVVKAPEILSMLAAFGILAFMTILMFLELKKIYNEAPAIVDFDDFGWPHRTPEQVAKVRKFVGEEPLRRDDIIRILDSNGIPYRYERTTEGEHFLIPFTEDNK